MANLRSGPGWADGDTSQYDSTMHNSHSEQQGGHTVKKNEGRAKPPLFVYCRWEFSSSATQTSGSHLLQESALFTGKGNPVLLGLSDLVCGRFQSGHILNKSLFVPLPAVPSLFWCAFWLLIRSWANVLLWFARQAILFLKKRESFTSRSMSL